MSRSTALQSLIGPVVLAAFAAAFFVRFADPLLHACLPFGDYPVIALDIDLASSFSLFTGPYSRFKFRHPGPALAYYHAALSGLFSAATGSTWYAAHLQAQLALNLAFLAGAASVVFAHLGRAGYSVLFIIAVLWSLPSAKAAVLTDVWGPSAIMVPTGAFLVSAASVASGRLRHSWLAALSAGLVLSTHIGTGVYVIPVSLAALLWGVRASQSSGSPRCAAALLPAGAVVSVLAWPPLYEAWTTPRGGNLALIVRFFGRGRETGHSVAEALEFTAGYLSPIRGGVGGTAWSIAAALALFALPPVFESDTFLRRLWALTAAAAVLLVLGATRIEGRLHPYLLWHAYVVFAVAWFVLLACTARRLLPALSTGGAGEAVFCVTALAAAVLLLPARFGVESGACPDGPEAIVRTLRGDGTTLLGVTPASRSDWDLMAKIVLYGRRASLPVCVPRRWRFMFGARATCEVRAPNPRFKRFVIVRMPPKAAAGAAPLEQETTRERMRVL